MPLDESKSQKKVKFPNWDGLQRRDQVAWQELFEYLFPKLQMSVTAKFGRALGQEDIEEIASDVIVDMYSRDFDKFIQRVKDQVDRASQVNLVPRVAKEKALLDWCYRKVRWKALERMSRGKRFKPLRMVNAEPHTSEDTDSRSSTLIAFMLSTNLSAEMMDILSMRYFHEMTYREIGEALGITEAAVRKRLVRAREKARAVLEKHLPEVLG